MRPETGEVECIDYHCPYCGERVNPNSINNTCPNCRRPPGRARQH